MIRTTKTRKAPAWCAVALSALALGVAGCQAQTTPAGGAAAGGQTAGGTAEGYKNREHFGLNIGGIADYSSELPFTDIFKTSRVWISQREGADWGKGPQLALDEHGYVTRLGPGGSAETPMLTDLGGRFPQGEYLLRYAGEGDVDLTGVAEIVAREPGRIIFKPKSDSGFFLRLNRIDPQNPVRDIHIYLPGQHDGKTFFNPTFLERLKPFGTIRFMDWGATNNSPLQKWDERPRLTDARWSTSKGVPIEVMVELANTLHANPWFNLPHQADDDFVRRYAQLVKAKLNPQLKVYVEYSNEVWNGQFEQARYALQQGKKLGLSDNDFQAQLRFYSQRAVEIGKIWREVFSDEPERVVRVMGSQSVNPWVSEQVLGWRDAYKNVDALAIAPYFGNQFGDPQTQDEVANWSVDELFNKLRAEVRGQNKQAMEELAPVAKKYGVKLIAYEGGQHLVGHGGAENNQKLQDLFIAANRDPRMAELYQEHLQNWFAAGGDLYAVFSSVGQPSKWGSWGLLEYQDQPIEAAPKYRAVVEFIQNADI